MKNQLVKINQDYSFELLASLLSELEFDYDFIKLNEQEFEFKDATAIVSGSIIGFRNSYKDEINSISCDFKDVIIVNNDNDDITNDFKFEYLLKLETLTEKYFKQ